MCWAAGGACAHRTAACCTVHNSCAQATTCLLTMTCNYLCLFRTLLLGVSSQARGPEGPN